MVVLAAPNGYLSDAELVQLRGAGRSRRAGLLFAALDADQARQVRGALGTELPVYGTSALNPGADRLAVAELDGVRLLDLPWQVQRDHPAVMVYPRRRRRRARPTWSACTRWASTPTAWRAKSRQPAAASSSTA